MKKKKIGLGIVGLGTVGGGLIEIIQKKNNFYKNNYKLDLVIIGISARSRTKKRTTKIKKYKWYKNPLEMVHEEKIDIIIELIGGSDGLALELAKESIKKGKYFVTANKALIAKYGRTLFELCHKYKSNISFEAAVGGGIPIIKLLHNSLLAGNIKNIYGILNGTCNYILTKMVENNVSFKTALKEAQNLGFAESDPYDDISGMDTAYKLAILSSLAFGYEAKVYEIFVEGIANIEETDIEMSDKLGYRILLLGIANLKNKRIMQRVHPCLVSKKSILSKVGNELNTVVVDDEFSEKTILIGKGAGKNPTAGAVVSDILNIFDQKSKRNIFNEKKGTQIIKTENIENREGRFYIRMGVEDKPGVLADVTQFFKKQKISIKSMFQLDKKIKNIVPLIFVTHKISEKKIKIVLKKIEALDRIRTKIILLRIEEL